MIEQEAAELGEQIYNRFSDQDHRLDIRNGVNLEMDSIIAHSVILSCLLLIRFPNFSSSQSLRMSAPYRVSLCLHPCSSATPVFRGHQGVLFFTASSGAGACSRPLYYLPDERFQRHMCGHHMYLDTTSSCSQCRASEIVAQLIALEGKICSFPGSNVAFHISRAYYIVTTLHRYAPCTLRSRRLDSARNTP